MASSDVSNKHNFELITGRLSGDTVACLEELLSQAERGLIKGLVFAASYRDRTFVTDSTGDCRINAIYARGLVAELDDELAQRTKR